MNRIATALVAVVTLLVMTNIAVHRLIAATPSGGAISADSPTITWAGRAWTAPNPLSCFSAGGIDPTSAELGIRPWGPEVDRRALDDPGHLVRLRLTDSTTFDTGAVRLFLEPDRA